MLRKTAQETRTVDPFTCDSIHSDVCVCVLLTMYAFTVCTHLECNVLLWSAMPCSTAWSWPPVLRPEDETDTTPTFSMPICLALFIDKQYNNKLEKKPAFSALSFYAEYIPKCPNSGQTLNSSSHVALRQELHDTRISPSRFVAQEQEPHSTRISSKRATLH